MFYDIKFPWCTVHAALLSIGEQIMIPGRNFPCNWCFRSQFDTDSRFRAVSVLQKPSCRRTAFLRPQLYTVSPTSSPFFRNILSCKTSCVFRACEIYPMVLQLRAALVRRFNFSRASHKSKPSAVLFIELITSAVLSLQQRIVMVQVRSYWQYR